MSASHCFVFFILLIAVKAFPQNAIASVSESSTIIENTEGIKSDIPIPQETVVSSNANEVSIPQNSEFIPEERIDRIEESEAIGNSSVVSTAPNEASIPQNAEVISNQTVAPVVPHGGIGAEASPVDNSESIASEIVVSTPSNKASIDDARLIAFEDYSIPSALADIDTVNQVQPELVVEDYALRSIISAVDSSTILPSSASEVVAEVPAALPVISDSLSSTEASVSLTSSVVSTPEAPVSSTSDVESVVPAGSKISLPTFESGAQSPDALGRSVLTDFPDIEVIIPLVDVSLPAISARSLDSEPVSTISTTAAASDFASSDVEPVPATTEVPSDVIPDDGEVVFTGSNVALPESESIAPANVDSSTGSSNIEISQDSLPDISSRTLDAESAIPVEASNSKVSDLVSNNSSSAIESVSSSTEVPTPSSSSVIPETESIALANESPVLRSSTGDLNIEVAVKIPFPELSSQALDVESPISSTEASVATSVSGLESESVSSSTTAVPVSEISAQVPNIEVVIPDESSRTLEPEGPSMPTNLIESESISSTTAAPEVPPTSVQLSELNVTSSTEASSASSSPGLEVVTTEASASSQTESPAQLAPTASIPCAQAGNFSVPTNCRIYLTCSTDGTDLTLTEHECPDRYVFSPVLRRCSRDISPCGDAGPTCLRPGSIADPNTSSAYYWCAPSLLGGYHKYHVHCDTNEVYVSSISRCLPEALHLSQKGVDSNLRSDRDIVKAEWKLLKKQIKHQAKEDKARQKLEAKAKAHAEKLATKNLKKQKGDTKKYDESDEEDYDEDED